MPPRDTRPTKAETAERTRNALLAAGAQLLREQPVGSVLSQVTAVEVSRRAGRTIGAFYHYWQDQQSYQSDLLDFVLAPKHVINTSKTITGVRSDIAHNVPVEEIIRRNARANFEALRDSSFTSLFMALWAKHDSDEKLRERLRHRFQKSNNRIVPVYRKFLDSQGWELRPPFTVDLLAVTLTALVQGLAIRAAVDPDAVPLELPSVHSAVEKPPVDGHLDERSWDLFSILVLALLPSMVVPKAERKSDSWLGHEDVRSLVQRLRETWESPL